jgi:Domain of unknown function (DUF5666)
MRCKTQVLAMALALTLSAGLWAAGAAAAQQDNPQPPAAPQQRWERGRAGNRAMGTITSVGVDRFEIKGRDGKAMTILVNNQTKYNRDQKSIALEDLKPGDQVFVRGQNNSDQQFTATEVREITEQDRQRFAGSRAFGRITAIQGNELTVSNRRQGERVVTVNDQTTFEKDGQPIALKDLKVGDRIAAFGKETDGKFEAERIMTGNFRRGRGMRRPGMGSPDMGGQPPM